MAITDETGCCSANLSGPFLLLPVAIGIAIVRYRLYDIDLIVNLTLVSRLSTKDTRGPAQITITAIGHEQRKLGADVISPRQNNGLDPSSER